MVPGGVSQRPRLRSMGPLETGMVEDASSLVGGRKGVRGRGLMTTHQPANLF